MRTTLDIDPDVLAAAREIAAALSQSIGQVISALARKGLEPRPSTATRPGGFPVFEVRPGARPLTLEDVRKDEDEE
jgi:hypothetical protein